MCTCCGDHRTSPYSLMSLSIASPFKTSVSFLKGISDRRQFIWRVTLCLFTTCRHPIKTPTIIRQLDLMNIIKRVIIQTGCGFVFLRNEIMTNVTLQNTDINVTSSTASYNMALWPGWRSVSSVLQHWQKASSLISGQWRSLSTAGERPECNGLSLHSVPMVSWQEWEKQQWKRSLLESSRNCF